MGDVTAWLFTIEQELDDIEVDAPFRVWTEPPRETDTGDIRRRADGDPYTPAWRTGDEVIVFYPGTGRCVALLTADGPAVWEEAEELFLTDLTAKALDPEGPTLEDIGVEKALQGGRHRLTTSQAGAAVKRLRGSGRQDGRDGGSSTPPHPVVDIDELARTAIGILGDSIDYEGGGWDGQPWVLLATAVGEDVEYTAARLEAKSPSEQVGEVAELFGDLRPVACAYVKRVSVASRSTAGDGTRGSGRCARRRGRRAGHPLRGRNSGRRPRHPRPAGGHRERRPCGRVRPVCRGRADTGARGPG